MAILIESNIYLKHYIYTNMGWFNRELSKTDIEIEHLKAKIDRLESQIITFSTHLNSLRGLVNRKLAPPAEIQEEEEELVQKTKKEDPFSVFKL